MSRFFVVELIAYICHPAAQGSVALWNYGPVIVVRHRSRARMSPEIALASGLAARSLIGACANRPERVQG
jgi:hypothetical protein